MDYIVLDLEWNQSTEPAQVNPKLHFEIIEIGAVRLNENRVIVREYSRLIRPRVYPTMHKITSKLIHLQMQQLENGSPFEEVAADFLSWCGEDYMFCTWGPLDLGELQHNLKYYGMPPLSKGPLRFLDVQKLFSIAFEDGKSRKSLEYAVDFLQIEKDIPFHRAFSDAYYAGRVLEKIPKSCYENVSFDVTYPPESREEEVKVIFPGYAKYISRTFANKTTALNDKEVASSKCYICHKNVKKKIRWFTPNGRNYYCIARCDVHGYLKGKIRVRKTTDGQVYVIKTTKLISDAEMEEIAEKREHALQTRRNRKTGVSLPQNNRK